jgi:galactokinase/mevalonate kinase-like predicted kinase
MVRVTAPGRGGIIGNPSDIYGGTVVSCTIGERADATVASSPVLIFDIYGQYQVIDTPDKLAYDPDLHYLDVAKAVWRYLRTSEYAEKGLIDPGATFHVRAQSNIPLMSGCAGSTAMLLVILAGILAHFDVELPRHELAELARRVERQELGVHCGFQDQYMLVFGGLNCVDLRGKENHTFDSRAPYATVEPLAQDVPNLPFILANSGVQRHSGQYHAEPRRKWENGDPAQVAGFERIGELGRLGKRALLNADWEWLGELMRESHALVQDLVGVGEPNERLINAAMEAGALGAKLSGAGRGGTIIVLHEAPEWMGAQLLAAGAERLIKLVPSPGLTIDRY